MYTFPNSCFELKIHFALTVWHTFQLDVECASLTLYSEEYSMMLLTLITAETLKFKGLNYFYRKLVYT